MDSIRMSKTHTYEPLSASSWAAIGLFVSFVLLGLGIHYDSGLLAGLGFLPFTISLLYLNMLLWVRIMGDQKVPEGYVEKARYWV